LPAFFFPPLAFFAIVFYPPLHVGLLCESAHVIDSVAAAWHAHPLTAIFASRHLRAVSASEGEDDMVEPLERLESSQGMA
jgi:hypothetical protein